MKRSEAIQILDNERKAYIIKGCKLDKAIDMAIEALSDRPTGRWIDYSDDGYVECPFCHSATNCDGNKDELHFCFSCGARMKGGDDE